MRGQLLICDAGILWYGNGWKNERLFVANRIKDHEVEDRGWKGNICLFSFTLYLHVDVHEESSITGTICLFLVVSGT